MERLNGYCEKFLDEFAEQILNHFIKSVVTNIVKEEKVRENNKIEPETVNTPNDSNDLESESTEILEQDKKPHVVFDAVENEAETFSSVSLPTVSTIINNGLRLVSIPDSDLIINAMQCSFCSKIPPPDSYACKKGHRICINCSKKIPSCPKEIPSDKPNSLIKKCCGKKFTRNNNDYLFNRIYNNTITQCRNSGCRMKLLGKDRVAHEVECKQANSLMCQSRKECGTFDLIPLEAYPFHLKDAHRVELINLDPHGRDVGYLPFNPYLKESQIVRLLQFSGEMFALQMKFTIDLVYCFLTQMKIAEQMKAPFKGHLQLNCPRDLSNTYSGRIRSFEESDEIVKLEHCLTVPAKTFERYVSVLQGRCSFYFNLIIQPCIVSLRALEWEPRRSGEKTNKLGPISLSRVILSKKQKYEDEEVLTNQEIFLECFNKFEQLYEEQFILNDEDHDEEDIKMFSKSDESHSIDSTPTVSRNQSEGQGHTLLEPVVKCYKLDP